MVPDDPAQGVSPAALEDAAESEARPRSRSFGRALARVALGVVVGLVITEIVFRERDGGAFPLVNLYTSDERCGVRLLPQTSTRVRGVDGRTTTVRVNREGFRGPDWKPAADGDVLVVGDSQSFGLGVEEDEAFPRALEARLRAQGINGAVLDASVPTYGPPDYETTLERVLTLRSPKTVVVSINLSNDFFELDQPNRERHAAFDGWAVRVDAGRSVEPSSPFVEMAIRDSHAAFALWRWQREKSLSPASLSPQRDFHDLVNLVTSAEQADLTERSLAEHERQAAEAALRSEVAAAKKELVGLVQKYEYVLHYASQPASEWKAYIAENADPIDHVFTIEYGGCEARSGTVDLPFTALRIRTDVESMLKEFATLPGLSKAEQAGILSALARRESAERALAHPASPQPLPPPNAHPGREMIRWLTRVKKATTAQRFVVVAIPVDIQASPSARSRREASDEDVAALDRLVLDLAESSAGIGVSFVDPTKALRELGDGAYLADGHLSARGHGAVAEALMKSFDL